MQKGILSVVYLKPNHVPRMFCNETTQNTVVALQGDLRGINATVGAFEIDFVILKWSLFKHCSVFLNVFDVWRRKEI